jgi:hypothetical protein
MAIHVALNHKTHYLYDRRRAAPSGAAYPQSDSQLLAGSVQIQASGQGLATMALWVTKDGTITPVAQSSIEGFQSGCPASPSMRVRRV